MMFEENARKANRLINIKLQRRKNNQCKLCFKKFR